MGSIPLPALAVKGPEPFSDDFIRMLSPRYQQMQDAQLKGANLENQQRELQNTQLQEDQADDHRWRAAIADPNWDGSSEQLLKNGLKQGVGAKSYTGMAHTMSALSEQYAKQGFEQLKVQDALGDHIGDQLQTVLDAKPEAKLT